MFGHRWEAGDATIVARHVKKRTGDGLVTIYEYAADVRLASGRSFRARLQEPKLSPDFWQPDVGEVVGVHVDEARQKAKFDRDDPTLSVKARRHRGDDDFAATLARPVGG